MTRILVTGASGLLGLNFCLKHYRQHDLIGVVKDHLLPGAPFPFQKADLSSPGEIERLIDQVEPELVVNCAAMANVDNCESQPEQTWQINVEFPRQLAKTCVKHGVKLVHLSTDAVFDGLRGNYTETDEPNPRGVYASTKLAGERAVLEALPKALVARVNFYGWSLFGTRSLAEFFYYNLSDRKPVNGFTDVFFCPLETTILSDILMHLANKGLSGLYHVVSSECLSKYEFGRSVAERFGLDSTLIQPISVRDSGLRAVRSPDLRLRSDKLAAVLGEQSPDQAESMDRFYSLYQAGYPQQVRDVARLPL